jgi:hypothetical protein
VNTSVDPTRRGATPIGLTKARTAAPLPHQSCPPNAARLPRSTVADLVQDHHRASAVAVLLVDLADDHNHAR